MRIYFDTVSTSSDAVTTPQWHRATPEYQATSQ